MKIINSFNKNHFVLEDKNKIIFQSYKSVVASFNKNKNELTLGIDWKYSRTTLRYLYKFIDEELPYIEDLYNTRFESNRKKAIQKLIDNKIIKYNAKLI